MNIYAGSNGTKVAMYLAYMNISISPSSRNDRAKIIRQKKETFFFKQKISFLLILS